jgi:hypothetical protein
LVTELCKGITGKDFFAEEAATITTIVATTASIKKVNFFIIEKFSKTIELNRI